MKKKKKNKITIYNQSGPHKNYVTHSEETKDKTEIRLSVV